MSGIEVKIWYVSGAFERISDVPDEEQAQGYYAEACNNKNVVAAEWHKADHTLCQGFSNVLCCEMTQSAWNSLVRPLASRDMQG